MERTTKYLFLALVIILIFFGLSCKHSLPVNNSNNNNNSGSGNNSNPCSPDTVYFKNEILPILVSNCAMSGCHDADTKKDGVNLTNYNSIISTADVTPFDPSKSDLYEVLIDTDPDKRMPPGNTLDAQLIVKIQKWIQQGALNNACSDCDTAGTMSFTNNVKPILELSCTGCHSGNLPSANIDLTSYTSVNVVAINGRLLGSIQHDLGFKPMPQNGNKLSDCDITIIKKWILDGSKNN